MIIMGWLILWFIISRLLKSQLTPEQRNSLKRIGRRSSIDIKEFMRLLGGDVTEEVTSKVLQLVAREVGVKPGQLRPNDRLFEDLALCTIDALDFTSIVIQLENKLKVRITDEEVTSIRTIGDLIRLFDGKFRRKAKES